MSKVLQDLKTRINDLRRYAGDDILDMDSEGLRAINAAIDYMQLKHDWEFTVLKQDITYYPNIDSYLLNTDYKAPISLDTQYKGGDYKRLQYPDFLNDKKYTYKYADKNVNGQKTVFIGSTGDLVVPHTLSSYDGNGTFANVAGVSSVSTDQYDYVDNTGSIKVILNAAVGHIRNTDMQQTDLTKYLDRSAATMNVKISSITNLSSFTLRIGSSATDYYEFTATTDYLGNSFIVGWNKLKFTDWTVNGSPDIAALDTLDLLANYSAPSTATIKYNYLEVGEEQPLTLEYYSNNFIYDTSAGTRKVEFEGDDDTDYPLYSDSYDWVFSTHIDIATADILNQQEEGQYDLNRADRTRREAIELARENLPSRRQDPEITSRPVFY